MHDEIVLMYNDPDAHLMDIYDAIGGCFLAEECMCGSAFCVGEMINRLKRDVPLVSDSYFFARNKNGALCVNVHLVELANVRFSEMFPRPECSGLSLEVMRKDVMKDMEDVVKKLMMTQLRRETLMNLFHGHVYKRHNLPQDMQALVPARPRSM